MAERSRSVDHVTIWWWVQRYAPVWKQRLRAHRLSRVGMPKVAQRAHDAVIAPPAVLARKTDDDVLHLR